MTPRYGSLKCPLCVRGQQALPTRSPGPYLHAEPGPGHSCLLGGKGDRVARHSGLLGTPLWCVFQGLSRRSHFGKKGSASLTRMGPSRSGFLLLFPSLSVCDHWGPGTPSFSGCSGDHHHEGPWMPPCLCARQAEDAQKDSDVLGETAE